MNYTMIKYILGWIFNFEAAFMAPSFVVGLIYREKAAFALFATMLLCLAIGTPMVCMYKYHQDADLLDSTLETETVGLEEENMVPNLSESVSIDADGVMHITMTNLDLEHAYPIETTILGKKVESIKAQIVTQEMHAKNTFEDPENVTVQSFEGVEKVHAGIRFTIPACSVLHIALK